MCRLFSLFSTNNTTVGQVGKDILLHLAANSLELRNKDGFFVTDDRNNIKRTLDSHEYLKFLNETDFDNSNWISAHMRLSTNKVNKKWIHGWLLAGYYCTHNGVTQNKAYENDSFSFFSEVAASKKPIIEAIKEVSEDAFGWGAFSMVSNKQKIFFSFNRALYLYYIKEHHILAISSNDDIWKFDREFIDMEKKDYSMEALGTLYFLKQTMKTEKLKLNKVDIESYDKELIDSFVVLNDKNLPVEVGNLLAQKKLGYYGDGDN